MTVLAPAPKSPDGPAPRRSFRLIAHLGWEAILLLLALIVAALVFVSSDSGRAFDGGLSINLAALGLLATGFALSLRTASPNLAVGAQATLAAVVYAKLVTEAGWAGPVSAAAVMLIVTVFGLVLGVLAGLTSAPAWAVSLGGLAIAQAVCFELIGGGVIRVAGGDGSNTALTAALWLAVFVLGSVAGGVVFLVPRVRRFLGTAQPAGQPGRFQLSRLAASVLGFGGSSALAALSGIVLVGYLRAAYADDSGRMLLAVAAVLLGGVSAFTFRGGVAGTVLAATLLVLLHLLLQLRDAPHWLALSLPAGVAILFGILAGWGLDKIPGPDRD